MEFLIDHNTDIAFITETWLKSDKNSVTAEIKNYGFELKHNIRKDREKEVGGGVGIIVKSSLVSTQMSSKQFQSFEHVLIKLSCSNNKKILLISIYRLQNISISVFYEEFTELLEMYTVLNNDFIIAGDINIHVETNESSSKKFHEIIDLFNLKQHVTGPTHIKGHTIDVIITRSEHSAVENVVINKYTLSHHFLIDWVFSADVQNVTTKTITYRNILKIDNEKFCEDIIAKYSITPDVTTMKEKMENYNNTMTSILNVHAPVRTKTIKIIPQVPWFDSEYALLRRKRRKAEKKYNKSGTQEDHDNYTIIRKETTALAKSKKKSFIVKKLASDKSSKNLYEIVNNMLDSNHEVALPSSSSDETLANDFRKYFSEKVNKIRASITTSDTSTSYNRIPSTAVLYQFKPATQKEIKTIVTSFKIKCSPEDPIPAHLLKGNIDTFIPYWLDIVNLSLELGSMDCLKSAVILPLIKELGTLVDKENLKNYRPVSNLQFISKLIERVVDIILEEHMTLNNLHCHHQFGYKKYHSTELLLLKIIDNLLLACDDNMPTVVLYYLT